MYRGFARTIRELLSRVKGGASLPYHRLIVVALGIVATAAFAFIGVSSGTSTPGDLLTMHNGGVDIVLTQEMKSVLSRTKVSGPAKLLGQVGEMRFYRISDTSRGSCYALGVQSGSFNLLACPGTFPSDQLPLLDFSVAEKDLASGESRLDSVQGFAADGIATVTVSDNSGRSIAQTGTSDNLYHISRIDGNGMKIVARDATGEVVYSKTVSSEPVTSAEHSPGG
jgi:hypothetical protein